MMPLWTTATRSVAIGWALVSVGRPCVAQRVWPMPIVPCTGSLVEPTREVGELAFGAAALDAAVDQGRDAGRIIAAIFEPAQPFDQPRRDRSLAMMPMMPHIILPPQPRPNLRRAPRLVHLLRAGDRQRVGGDILVITLPAATIAPSPTVTGATSAVFEPINAPSPIIVRYLLTPS